MKTSNHIFTLIISLILLNCETTPNKPLLVSPLFSDNMVLQQEEEVFVWGIYAPNEEINISGSWGNETSVITNNQGNWKAQLETPKAGGPYSVEIKAKDTTIVINDVLIGEVWLASGQSNMEMSLKGFPSEPIDNHEEEIKNANYEQIRMLTVKRNLSIETLDTISGKWLKTNPENVGEFSASAYFFARKLYKELRVPIGIIHSSWGGTPAEAWTSKECLKTFEDFNKTIDMLDDPNIQSETKAWFEDCETVDVPQTTEQWQELSFSDEHYTMNNFDDANWTTITLPGRFDELNDSSIDGAMWLRKEFEINNVSGNYVLNIGAVDDMDVAYINGQKIGGLMGFGFWQTPRQYTIPEELLKVGKNIIAIRVIDTGGPGTVIGPIEITNANQQAITLEGTWKYRLLAEVYQGKYQVY